MVDVSKSSDVDNQGWTNPVQEEPSPAQTDQPRQVRANEFDLLPFWNELVTILQFVRKCLKYYGQTDALRKAATRRENERMEEYLMNTHGNLRKHVFKDSEDAGNTTRLEFWNKCRTCFAPVWNYLDGKPKRSVNFNEFYACLYDLQVHALSNKYAAYWPAGARPVDVLFKKEVRSWNPVRDRESGCKERKKKKKSPKKMRLRSNSLRIMYSYKQLAKRSSKRTARVST